MKAGEIILARVEGLRFLRQNLLRAMRLSDFGQIDMGPVGLRAFRGSDLTEISDLHRKLNDGISIGVMTRLLLRLCGPKLCLVAMDKSGKTVGMELFYFNQRDLREGTIHEGFIGVDRTYEGKGIATQMRLHSRNHFLRTGGFVGISSRISRDNLASLTSARKAGFSAIEEYTDDDTGERRLYLLMRPVEN